MSSLPEDDALQMALRMHRDGRAADAEAAYRQILTDHPQQPYALHLLGVLLAQGGYRAAAAELIGQAIAIQPGLAEAHGALGRILADQGKLPEAIAHYQQAATLGPDDLFNWFNLGITLQMTGKWDEAITAFAVVMGLDPADSEGRRELDAVLKSLGKMDQALAALGRALAMQVESVVASSHSAFALVDQGKVVVPALMDLGVKMPGFLLELGKLLARRNLHLPALSLYSEAIKVAPDFASAYSARGMVLAEMKGFEPALADHRRAIELSPEDISMHLAMIETLKARGDFDEAERCARRAVEMEAGSSQAWESLGTVLQMLGKFSEASACLRRCLEIQPSAAASLLLARMPGETRSSDEGKIIELLEKPDLPAMDRVAGGFALGSLLDESGRFEEAFAAYAGANALFKDLAARQGQRFDGLHLQRMVDEMIATATADYFRQRSDFGQKSELPVFVVGMPRSGTTLVEQILASHSCVAAAGELTEIGMIRAQLAAMDLQQSPRHWQRHWHRHLAKVHLAKLAILGRDAARVVDKMPANILHLGLIATMFPGARVILCERDPRDTCLSCFFQLFDKHNLMFSYDLIDCAWQYSQQQRLSEHWKRVLPIRMLSMQYEDLVADLPGQSRRLIDFAGLGWEAGCLDFHRPDRPVLTRSVWQVRQPIYTRSVGRWKHYEKHLGALMAGLPGAALRAGG